MQRPPRRPALTTERRFRRGGRLKGPAVALADRGDDILARTAEAERPHHRRNVTNTKRNHLAGRPDTRSVRKRRVEAPPLHIWRDPAVVPRDDLHTVVTLKQLLEPRQVVERHLILDVQHLEAEVKDALDIELMVTVTIPS